MPHYRLCFIATIIILNCVCINFAITVIENIDFDLHEDPDITDDVPTLIRRHGYPVETHFVTTDDGFILQLFRIPYGKQNESNNTDLIRRPVLLQHGLLADSSCWILAKGSSLAFILADSGYDVWLGNFRGSIYASNHTKYTPEQYEFWDFSWDEMAHYDLPSIFKYINSETQEQILYIGHSMGTTTFYASLSTFPENAKYCKAMFSLAPVAYMSKIFGPINLFVPFASDFAWIMRMLGIGQFLPSSKFVHLLVKFGCSLETTMEFICENVIFAFMGFDESQFKLSILKSILSHMPSTTSVRTVVQYSQEVKPDRFQHYDFGKTENVKRYGTITPPIYNISKISVPISIYWGQNDWLSQKDDVDRLWSEIPNKFQKFIVPWKSFNHLDFLWSKDVKPLLYDQLLLDLKQFS